MSRPIRLTLLALGLVMLCCSLIVLVYAYWPVDTAIVGVPLEPTLLSPP